MRDPGVVEGHPDGFVGDVGGFDSLPEGGVAEGAEGAFDGALLPGVGGEMEEFAEDGAGWWGAVVFVPAEEEDEGGEAEGNCGSDGRSVRIFGSAGVKRGGEEMGLQKETQPEACKRET